MRDDAPAAEARFGRTIQKGMSKSLHGYLAKTEFEFELEISIKQH